MSAEQKAHPPEHERYQELMNFNELSGFDELETFKEFAEMKILWDRQNEEKLYAINEQVLHKQIQRRRRAVDRTVQRVEWALVGANLLVSIFLTGVAYINHETLLFYTIAIAYLLYALLFLVLHRLRSGNDRQFEPTMLGDLDRAIWQLNHLVHQARSMMVWYSLPLTLILSGFAVVKGQWWAALAVLVVMAAASYLSIQWEVKRCYLPQVQSLEALRAKLVAP